MLEIEPEIQHAEPLFRAMYVYLLIVASHMLGRFFYNNDERLDWF